MIAEDGIIELEVGGRTAQMRFLRETTAACPALSRMAFLGQMSCGMAHDINNLLSVISGNLGYFELDTDLSDNRAFGESRGQILRDISKAVESIASLCRRIQSLGSQKNEVTVVRVTDAVEDSLAFLKFNLKSIRKSGLNLEIKNLVPGEFHCLAIPAELMACTLNIVKNALEHGFRGRDSGVILIEAFAKDNFIRLDISNDGQVIPTDISEILLKRPLSIGCNTGIGLFTAAERLRSFGSWMTFSSEPDLTVFSIYLVDANAKYSTICEVNKSPE